GRRTGGAQEEERNSSGRGRARRPRKAVGNNHRHFTTNQIAREARKPIQMIVGIALLDHEVLPLDEPRLLQAPTERLDQFSERVRRRAAKKADHRHRRLLRARRKRPSGSATKQRDEVAPSHSITSSARASNCGGTSRPSALAVFRLITSSNLVGCNTGKSIGLAPLRMRPA